jgi:hypothetical protein
VTPPPHKATEPTIAADFGSTSLESWLDLWTRHGQRRVKLFATLRKAADVSQLTKLLDVIRDRLRRWQANPTDDQKASIEADIRDATELVERIRRYQ